jgi:hypothetical protein
MTHPANIIPWHLYNDYFTHDRFIAGLFTVSEANATGEHFRNKSKRHKKQQIELFAHLYDHPITVKTPAHVTFYRHSPRFIDDDNLVSAFKHVKDYFCDYLLPGLAPGRADGKLGITWSYMQCKSKKKGIGIRVYEAKKN